MRQGSNLLHIDFTKHITKKEASSSKEERGFFITEVKSDEQTD